jgi:methylmalonyl-CoA mutase cobalamin-binding subunit
MVAGVFALGGAHCISLGPQTPVEDIGNAARAHGVDIVVLSFSTTYPQRRILPALAELRQRLAESVEVWAGGSGTLRLADPENGIRLLPTLEEAEAALGQWREAHPEA